MGAVYERCVFAASTELVQPASQGRVGRVKGLRSGKGSWVDRGTLLVLWRICECAMCL